MPDWLQEFPSGHGIPRVGELKFDKQKISLDGGEQVSKDVQGLLRIIQVPAKRGEQFIKESGRSCQHWKFISQPTSAHPREKQIFTVSSQARGPSRDPRGKAKGSGDPGTIAVPRTKRARGIQEGRGPKEEGSPQGGGANPRARATRAGPTAPTRRGGRGMGSKVHIRPGNTVRGIASSHNIILIKFGARTGITRDVTSFIGDEPRIRRF